MVDLEGRQLSRWAGLLMAALLLGACRGESLARRPETSARGPASIEAVRGTIRFRGDSIRFAPCDSARHSVLLDSTGGALAAVRQSFGSVTDSLYAELDGYSVGDAIVATRVRRANAGEGIGCRQPTLSSPYIASGTEPFWAIEVTQRAIIYRSPEHLNGLVFTGPPPDTDSAGVVIFRGTRTGSGASAITLRIRQAPCNDGMSGEYFGWVAEVDLDGRTLKGCASKSLPLVDS